MEHSTLDKVPIHPCTAGQSLHDLTDIGDVIVLIEFGSFLSLSNVFAVRAVIGHDAALSSVV